MTTEIQQSAIAEVRDQLSVDYADGEYLNHVGANLGMDRPSFGFTDAAWRALVKATALQFKQIRNKFRDVLAIIFGPQVTEGASIATAVAIDDLTIVVNDASELPQVGTLILDEGLATQETREYTFINYRTNTIFLDVPVDFTHAAQTIDVDEPLVFDALIGATTVFLSNARDLTIFPTTIVLSRGLAAEEVVTASAAAGDTGAVTVAALTNNHTG